MQNTKTTCIITISNYKIQTKKDTELTNKSTNPVCDYKPFVIHYLFKTKSRTARAEKSHYNKEQQSVSSITRDLGGF